MISSMCRKEAILKWQRALNTFLDSFLSVDNVIRTKNTLKHCLLAVLSIYTYVKHEPICSINNEKSHFVDVFMKKIDNDEKTFFSSNCIKTTQDVVNMISCT